MTAHALLNGHRVPDETPLLSFYLDYFVSARDRVSTALRELRSAHEQRFAVDMGLAVEPLEVGILGMARALSRIAHSCRPTRWEVSATRYEWSAVHEQINNDLDSYLDDGSPPVVLYPWLRDVLSTTKRRASRVFESVAETFVAASDTERTGQMRPNARRLLAWDHERMRVRDGLAALGFSSATELLASHPYRSLEAIASEVSPRQFAPAQLRRKVWEEAALACRTEHCARDLLVRDLYDFLPHGWTTRSHGPRGSVFFTWERSLPRNYWTAASLIYLTLKRDSIPEGWLPDDAQDPRLLEVFGSLWPKEPRHTHGHLMMIGDGGFEIVFVYPSPDS